MSRLISRAGAVLALAATAATLVVAQDAASPFVVGVWGQGDAIIPFADFDGRRWRSNWPAPVETEPDPRPLHQIPAAWWGRSFFRPTWELVEASGRRRDIQITGTDAATLGSSCSINLGLTTDVPAGTYRYGTVLAANRPGVLEPVEELTSNSAAWRTVSALLPGVYREREAQAWKEVSHDFRPDLTVPLSRPNLDVAFAAADESGQYVYFESSRGFARRREQFGSERSFITGWLWRRTSESSFQVVVVRAATNDVDGKGVQSFRPLGVVRRGAQRFWLGSLWSYAYSGLTVLDISRGGVRPILVVDYAGC